MKKGFIKRNLKDYKEDIAIGAVAVVLFATGFVMESITDKNLIHKTREMKKESRQENMDDFIEQEANRRVAQMPFNLVTSDYK